MQTIGIDLGTTNTVAACNAGVLPLRNVVPPNPILPSVVAFPPTGGQIVGIEARTRRTIDPKNTIFSAKRVIGETWHSYRAAEFRRSYPFDLVELTGGRIAFSTRAGTLTPTEIATAVVRALCAGVELEPSETAAVVTVPASFGAAQREATLEAVRGAGFGQVASIAEPVATAIAYLDRTSIRYGVVFDLGGGTFDLAVIDCSSAPLTVVAYGGDSYLGGDDIDRALAKAVADEVLAESGWDLRGSSEVFERLVLDAERAKIELSAHQTATLRPNEIDAAAPPLADVVLDRQRLWRIVDKLVGRAFGACDEVLADAGLRADDIQAVFLAGGATLTPGVRQAVAEYFGPRVRSEFDPMQVVSVGASMAAARPRLSGLLG